MTKRIDQLFHYADCGLSKIYLKGISLNQCTNFECAEEEVVIPNMEELHQLLAEKVASASTKLLPEEIRFLRTHLGFSGIQFAQVMGVSAETVSRWEKGSVSMKEATERLLRVLVLSKFGPFRKYDDLKKFASLDKKTPHKHVFKANRNHWSYDEVA